MTRRSPRAMLAIARLAVLAAFAALTLAAPASAAPKRAFPPVDEAVRVPDFFAFRARLLAAVAARDTTAVLGAIDPNVQTSFDADNGIDQFLSQWRIESPESRLWRELGTLLALGGSFQPGDSTFVAPYVFSRWPQDLDSYDHVAIVREAAIVRSSPWSGGAEIARVGFQILKRAPADKEPSAEKEGWARVTLDDGRIGYVENADARSPLDFRAIFSRVRGEWRMAVLIAGD